MSKFKITLLSGCVLAGVSMANAVHAADLYSGKSDMEWTGFYAGAHVGVAAGEVFFSSDDITKTGVGSMAGMQLGFDFDAGNFVWGIVGDINLSDVMLEEYTGGSDHVWTPEIMASVRGRVGMKFGVENRTLLYGTAGLGIVDGLMTSSTESDSKRNTFKAPVLGVGFEHRVTDALSVYGEGLAFLMDDRDENDETDVKTHGMMKLGVNVRF